MHPRWKSFRWVGLFLTAFYWGALVVAEVTRTAEEQTEGEPAAAAASCIGGLRCVSHVNDVAFSVKWVAQLLNQIFVVSFIRLSTVLFVRIFVFCTEYCIHYVIRALFFCVCISAD